MISITLRHRHCPPPTSPRQAGGRQRSASTVERLTTKPSSPSMLAEYGRIIKIDQNSPARPPCPPGPSPGFSFWAGLRLCCESRLLHRGRPDTPQVASSSAPAPHLLPDASWKPSKFFSPESQHVCSSLADPNQRDPPAKPTQGRAWPVPLSGHDGYQYQAVPRHPVSNEASLSPTALARGAHRNKRKTVPSRTSATLDWSSRSRHSEYGIRVFRRDVQTMPVHRLRSRPGPHHPPPRPSWQNPQDLFLSCLAGPANSQNQKEVPRKDACRSNRRAGRRARASQTPASRRTSAIDTAATV
ncbi:hypothetical protein CMUS01_04474 [Colletotrichum musicola]|uniref:Uncharacterized protein n=1 Tax=Colletotrichum musicola TaxID=2175873 RepID=A0A8H6NM84_9PEZI|nr:hypothetical protein CMUS01_04474 [Colletotrichum musicola]